MKLKNVPFLLFQTVLERQRLWFNPRPQFLQPLVNQMSSLHHQYSLQSRPLILLKFSNPRLGPLPLASPPPPPILPPLRTCPPISIVIMWCSVRRCPQWCGPPPPGQVRPRPLSLLMPPLQIWLLCLIKPIVIFPILLTTPCCKTVLRCQIINQTWRQTNSLLLLNRGWWRNSLKCSHLKWEGRRLTCGSLCSLGFLNR